VNYEQEPGGSIIIFKVTIFAWKDSRISTEILIRTDVLGAEEGEI
jgi:hypothetical protein